MRKKRVRLKSTKQIKQFNGALRKGARINHVIKHENGWAVKKRGSQKASIVIDDQNSAIKKAKQMANRDKSGVVIHGKNGKIRSIRSF